MLVKNRWLDAIIILILTFFLTYLLRLALEGGNYSIVDNCLTHILIAVGLTIGLSLIPSLARKRKT